MSNTVIVDDRSAQITYSSTPGWFSTGTFPDWNKTSMQPRSEGASFEMTFQGTSVEVLGVLHSPGGDPGTPSIPVVSSFSIDGGAVTNFTGPSSLKQATFFNSFYTASNLDPAKSHTLKWTQANNGTIFLDAIIYETSSAFSPQTDTNYIVDQGDPRVQYEGSWIDLDSDQVFKGRLKFGRKYGDTMSFKFNGSAIAVYGNLDPLGIANTEGNIPTSSTIVTYTVDSGGPMKAAYPIPTSVVYGEQLFLYNDLPSNQEHTFTMKLENNQPIYVDYLIVSPVGGGIARKSDLFANAQQQAISGSTTGLTGAPTSSSSSGGGSSPNVGAIAGGVIGGVGFVALCMLAFLLLRNRRKTRSGEAGATVSSSDELDLFTRAPSFEPASFGNGAVDPYFAGSQHGRSTAGTTSSKFSRARSIFREPPPYHMRSE
ncbi:hypothetical protein DL96DRAFT_1631343 [Flagelloscypha sp. PMI_526]|nr:hypothetical protein DL96DRAFT_1631343 [Flagelloscypha sp. PMI_526]